MATLLRTRSIKGTKPDVDVGGVPNLECRDSSIISIGLTSDTAETQATVLAVFTDTSGNIVVGTFQATYMAVKGILFHAAHSPLVDSSGNPPAMACVGALAYIGVISITPVTATVTFGAMVR